MAGVRKTDLLTRLRFYVSGLYTKELWRLSTETRASLLRDKKGVEKSVCCLIA